jgi:NADH-quinone oxidoreductase subunit A
MLNEFSHVFAFILLAVIFVAGGLLTNAILRPKHPNPFKQTPYECGEDPEGGSWVKFNVRYYVVALIFVLFDVEVIFLFPWALVYKKMGWLAFGEMFAFIGVLLVGYAYAWGKGDLEWARPKPKVVRLKDVVAVVPKGAPIPTIDGATL